MSLLTYKLDYGCHVVRPRRRRRAYVPMSNSASMLTMRKSIQGLPLLSYMGMGLRTCGQSDRWSSAKTSKVRNHPMMHCKPLSIEHTPCMPKDCVSSI